MTYLDAIGHFGYALIFAGMWQLAHGHNGFPLRLAGELLWVALGFAMGMTSIWIWGLLFACVDVRGWWNWRREYWWK